MNETLKKIADVVNNCLGPLGSAGFSWSTIRDFLIQIIALIILFIVVRHFFWSKITALLEARQKATDKELADAQAASKRVKELEASLKADRDKAQGEIKAMIASAEKDTNERREEIIAGAKAEAKRRLDNVQAELEQEIELKNKQIKQQIVDIAFAAAEKIVAREIKQDKYIDVVNDIIDGGGKK